jgi:TRAP-type mannitol/chloroaromatic compound transport system permease small subunit
METVKKIVYGIESLSIRTGKIASWAMVLLMVLINFEVAMRYIFVRPTTWGYELSLMLGGSFLLMLAFVQKRDSNIRVGIIYERLSLRTRAFLNVFGTVVFAYPCFVYLIIQAYQYMINSFATNEKMAESYWYPPAAPFRTMLFIALCLAVLQFTATLIRDLHMLIKGEPL